MLSLIASSTRSNVDCAPCYYRQGVNVNSNLECGWFIPSPVGTPMNGVLHAPSNIPRLCCLYERVKTLRHTFVLRGVVLPLVFVCWCLLMLKRGKCLWILYSRSACLSLSLQRSCPATYRSKKRNPISFCRLVAYRVEEVPCWGPTEPPCPSIFLFPSATGLQYADSSYPSA